MGIPLIYIILFLCALLVLGIVLLISAIKKKSLSRFLLSLVLMTPMTLISTMNYIDEVSISKKDIIYDLKYLEIELKDDFKIKENIVTGMPERIQETELEISINDKRRIIEIIKNGTNSYTLKQEKELVSSTSNTEDKIFNVEYPDFYSIEIHKKIDNYPTRMILTIHQKSNVLKYQRIED